MLKNELPLDLFSPFAPLLLVLPVFYYGASAFRKSKVLESWEKYSEDVKVLMPYLRPRDKTEVKNILGLVVAVFLCVGFGRVVNVVSPLMLRSIVDQLSASDGRQGPFPWKPITGYVLLRYPLREIMDFVQWAVTRRLENQVMDRITIAVYNKMMSLSADYHDSKNSGTVWLTVSNSGSIVSTFAGRVCFEMIPNILDLVLAAFAFGSVCGAHLAWFMILVLAVYVFFQAKTTEMDAQNEEEWRDAMDKKDNIASDTIPNWWTVCFFNRLDYEMNRHEKTVHHMRAVDSKWCESLWLSHNGKHLVSSAGLLILCLLVSHDIWYTEGRSGGDLVMFLHLWGGVIGPIQNVLDWDDRIKTFSLSSKRLLDILRQETTVTDCEGAKDFQFKNGSIEVHNVTFSYNEKRKAAVQDISFEVEGGKTVAIVGKSGGGKSTLLKLLMRSYDTISGSITIDGQNIKDVRKATLLQHISIVPQSIGVFNTSILENLRYAKFDATLEECEEVCRAVGLHEKITGSFDKGYDENIGERGGKLSGGELQRLAIARVLLRDSKFVLFDEAMSSLDAETEFKIQEYLRKWCVGRTVIIVAHRLITISNADVILAVKDGRIVERGSQEELLAKKGYYYELWDKQRLA
ncbi:hypothetical protein MMC11_002195 [Xylographa trunciseda]|nr:hypothetical protein [Xylographa trunciseda]